MGRSSGRRGLVERRVRMVAGEVFVAFERVEDDWTERGPACKRRWAAAERVSPNRNVGEIPACLWAGFIYSAEVAFQEHAAFTRTP